MLVAPRIAGRAGFALDFDRAAHPVRDDRARRRAAVEQGGGVVVGDAPWMISGGCLAVTM